MVDIYGPKQDNVLEKYNLPKNKFFIGSFQRDTEGHDLISPKLSKGPDIFIEYFYPALAQCRREIHVDRAMVIDMSSPQYSHGMTQSVVPVKSEVICEQ